MSMSFTDAVTLVDREMALGHYEIAMTVLEQMDRQVPGNVEILRRLGYCVAKVGNVPGGMEIIGKAAAGGDAGSAIILDMLTKVMELPAKWRGGQIDLECLRHTYFMDYPKTVTIETYAKCNADCVFCPYSSMERKGTRMSDELFDKIVSDLTAIPPHVPFFVAPFKVNEPFLDKRIFSMCHTINAKLPNAKIEIFSNGSTLTEANLEKLSEVSRLEFLWISLNQYRREPYEATMRLRYDLTMARLADLHKALETGRLNVPVKVSRVCDGSDEDIAFKNFLNQHFPRFQVMLVGRMDWAGQVEVERQLQARPDGCTRWYEINIMATGKVALCCMDGKGEHVVGDVAELSVLEIYNSPGYRALRETVRVRKDAGVPCVSCSL